MFEGDFADMCAEFWLLLVSGAERSVVLVQTRERGHQWPSAPAEFFKIVNGSYAGIFNPFIKKNVDIPCMLKSIL